MRALHDAMEACVELNGKTTLSSMIHHPCLTLWEMFCRDIIERNSRHVMNVHEHSRQKVWKTPQCIGCVECLLLQ